MLKSIVGTAALMLTASAVAQPECSWELVSETGPAARIVHAMAFDQARGELVLFGGYGGSDETWIWDGVAWEQRAVDGPPARAGHSMAYDPVRELVVLAGGVTTDGSAYFEDTWAWDGEQWSQLAATSFGAVLGAEMTFDESRGRLLALGGANDGRPRRHVLAWDWSRSAWDWDLVPDFHGNLLGHAFAYHQDSEQSILFGVGSSDTWALTDSQWELRAAQQPLGRLYSDLVAYPDVDALLLFGGDPGDQNEFTDQSWLWTDRWVELSLPLRPQARRYHQMAYDSVRREVVLFGGAGDGGRFGDTWVFRCELCEVDLTGDGVVDTLDFLLFLGAWAQGQDLADWNGDGTIDTLDFLAFLNEWVEAC